MNTLRWIATVAIALGITACGGGGGSSGSTSFGSGSGTSTGGTGTNGGTTTSTAYAVSVEVDRAAAATSQISSTETVQAVATVTSNGTPVEGVVVTFSELGGSLLTFAPSAATSLSGADGKASVDVKATASSGIGATTVQASAAAASGAYTASKSFQITAGAVTPGVPPVPGAINFVGSVPSATAIVIKGAGGTGRSESAILTFRIVDATNAPISAATVDFAINTDNGGATINQQSAVSDLSGLVTVSVASGTQPASIVVTAKAHSLASITSQSDTLLVSNGVPVPQAFELVAVRYNLDGYKTGDSTTITAFLADVNGNPVPDGVAVSFQTDLGVVASSTLGGCVTVNGRCTVDYTVQDPRGDGLATVIGTVRVGNSSTLSDSLPMHIAAPGNTPYLAILDNGAPVTQVVLSSCKQSFGFRLSDGTGHAAAAETVISAAVASPGVVASVIDGTPVLDQIVADFPPSVFIVQVDLTDVTNLVPACKPTGGVIGSSASYFNLKFTTSGGRVRSQRVQVAYPQ